jgi:lipopolysaccharide heptosyltransferase II
MQRQAEWTKFRNILCIRLDNLGDVLMTTPAIRALKESVSGRKITLLTSSTGAAIAGYIPEIDETILFDTPWEKNPDAIPANAVSGLIEQLKERNFEAAVIFTVYSQNPLPTAMLCYLAGIPRIAGYCRENPYRLMTDWLPDPEPIYNIKHEVNRQLDLVKNLGSATTDNSLSLNISAEAVKRTADKLAAVGIDLNKKSIVIHPGVSESRRQYPVNLYAEAAKTITRESDCHLLLTGLASEKELTDRISETAGEKAFSLAGMLNMEELIAVIKKSSLLIANNTGPVHIAAAVKTPAVVLYALTNPQHAPWNIPYRLLPFDVPEENRSKNVIIRLAHEKAFKKTPQPVRPEDIASAARELMKEKKGIKKKQECSIYEKDDCADTHL